MRKEAIFAIVSILLCVFCSGVQCGGRTCVTPFGPALTVVVTVLCALLLSMLGFFASTLQYVYELTWVSRR